MYFEIMVPFSQKYLTVSKINHFKLNLTDACESAESLSPSTNLYLVDFFSEIVLGNNAVSANYF